MTLEEDTFFDSPEYEEQKEYYQQDVEKIPQACFCTHMFSFVELK